MKRLSRGFSAARDAAKISPSARPVLCGWGKLLPETGNNNSPAPASELKQRQK
jgi:hypothetical protein